jgi:hypothetical protein
MTQAQIVNTYHHLVRGSSHSPDWAGVQSISELRARGFTACSFPCFSLVEDFAASTPQILETATFKLAINFLESKDGYFASFY